MSRMIFICDICEKERDFARDYGMCIIDNRNVFRRFCRSCRNPQVGMPDVFWDGKPEENLADDPLTGKPRVFLSKGHKAAYLKERGLTEAGSRVHGAPLTSTATPPPRDTRHEVRMALKQAKEMGRDVRRQEYLRILKEGQRHAQKAS